MKLNWHIKFLLSTSLVLSILLSPGLASGYSAEIHVSNTPLVKGSKILLKDIAEFIGFDRRDLFRIQQITLGDSPKPLEPTVISRGDIEIALTDHDFNLQDIEIFCEDRVTVHRRYTTVTPDDVKMLVLDYVKSKTNLDDGLIDITDISLLEPLIFADDEIEFSIRPGSEKLEGQISFQLTVRNPLAVLGRYWLTARISVFVPVIQTRYSIPKNSVIRKEQLYMVKRDSSDVDGRTLHSFDDIVGRSARIMIKANTPITSQMVEMPPIARRGQIVTIIAEKGPVKISAKGRLLEDGFQNEPVSVTNLQSNKTVYGQLVSSDEVRLTF